MSDPLDRDLIGGSINKATHLHLDTLEVLDVVPSTNTWLMQQERHDTGRFHAVLAEHQTAGRGQRSKRWYSPAKSGLCLSLGYTFARGPKNLSCLTLAAGVAVVKALLDAGAGGLALKWPNDLYAGDAKLGGILTDAQTAPGGRITMICGIGINIDLSLAQSRDEGREHLHAIDYSVTDLKSHAASLPDRSRIAAMVIEQVIEATLKFEELGLEPFRDDWNELDWLHGKRVDVKMPDNELSGVADGIDANGALRVTTAQGKRRVYTGTVRVVDDWGGVT